MSHSVKTSKTRKIIAVGLFAVVLAVLTVVWLLPRTPKITEEQFDQIQVGMTLAEVEAVLGCRPGNHSSCEVFEALLPDNRPEYVLVLGNNSNTCVGWVADKPEPRYTDELGLNRQDAIGIAVWSDENEKVVDKVRTQLSYPHSPSSMWDQIRRLLRTIAPNAF